jgi:cell division protein FtsQ
VDTSRVLAKNKKTKVHKNTVTVNLILVILIVIVGLMTPVFGVSTFEVNGARILSEDKIIDASGIKDGSNIFLFRTSVIEKKIKELSFVENVKVKRALPNKVIINIEERKPVAQVACGESLFIVIDSFGMILDTTNESLKYAVPLISDVSVSQFQVGKRIVVSDSDDFPRLMKVSTELYENMLLDRVKRIYSDINGAKIEVEGGIVCEIGNGDNIPYRVKFIGKAIAGIPKGKKGTIEFIDERKAVFKPNEG